MYIFAIHSHHKYTRTSNDITYTQCNFLRMTNQKYTKVVDNFLKA